jgi:hypothetical protein
MENENENENEKRDAPEAVVGQVRGRREVRAQLQVGHGQRARLRPAHALAEERLRVDLRNHTLSLPHRDVLTYEHFDKTGTLSRWSRLHLQSLAPTPVSKRVDVKQAAGRLHWVLWWFMAHCVIHK